MIIYFRFFDKWNDFLAMSRYWIWIWLINWPYANFKLWIVNLGIQFSIPAQWKLNYLPTNEKMEGLSIWTIQTWYMRIKISSFRLPACVFQWKLITKHMAWQRILNGQSSSTKREAKKKKISIESRIERHKHTL